MLGKIRILLCAIGLALLLTMQAFAWLDVVADRYLDPYAGFGLDAEKISNLNFNGGDDFRDLVVTHQTNGGHVYVNRHTLFPPYFTLHPQSLAAGGWQARFGLLRQGQPYKDLAVADGWVRIYFNNNTGTLQ